MNSIQSIQIIVSIIVGSFGTIIGITSLILSIYNFKRDKSRFEIVSYKAICQSFYENETKDIEDTCNIFFTIINTGRRSGMIKKMICYIKTKDQKRKAVFLPDQMISINEKQSQSILFIIKYEDFSKSQRIILLDAENKRICIDKKKLIEIQKVVEDQKNDNHKSYQERDNKSGKMNNKEKEGT